MFCQVNGDHRRDRRERRSPVPGLMINPDLIAGACTERHDIRVVPPVVPGRVLHIDADMLAYWSGGSEDTSIA